MPTALLDTSTNTAVFALIENNKQVFYREKTGRFGASVILPEMLRDAQNEGFPVNSISTWFVGKGPGSFTGTRVGIAFSQGLATGCGATMRGSNSGLLFIPALIKKFPQATSLAILHDGRRDEAIVNTFHLTDGEWCPTDIFICKINEIKELCQDINCLGSTLTTETYGDDAIELADKLLCEIKPDPMGLLLDSNPLPSNNAEEDHSLAPIYVRPAVFIKPLVTRDL